MRICAIALLLLLSSQTLSACQTRHSSADEQTLEVYAAASLTDAFRELAQAFEKREPRSALRLTFAGAQILRLQIEKGAPADVFASANPKHLLALVKSKRVDRGRLFAHNRLVIAVPPDNPAHIGGLTDLTKARALVLGTPEVPIGAYTRRALRRAEGRHPGLAARVLAKAVSFENNVRLLRAKVALAQADAAVVFQTDTLGSERVKAVPIPEAFNVRADYLLGIVDRCRRRDLAGRWLGFIASPVGHAILRRHGFIPPASFGGLDARSSR